jgi:N-methylhydantoinase A
VSFSGKRLQAAIHSRDSLVAGRKYSGPAVVTEYSATTVIPSGVGFEKDRAGNLMIEIGLSARKSEGQ